MTSASKSIGKSNYVLLKTSCVHHHGLRAFKIYSPKEATKYLSLKVAQRCHRTANKRKKVDTLYVHLNLILNYLGVSQECVRVCPRARARFSTKDQARYIGDQCSVWKDGARDTSGEGRNVCGRPRRVQKI